jgi:hypothetical protein
VLPVNVALDATTMVVLGVEPGGRLALQTFLFDGAAWQAEGEVVPLAGAPASGDSNPAGNGTSMAIFGEAQRLLVLLGPSSQIMEFQRSPSPAFGRAWRQLQTFGCPGPQAMQWDTMQVKGDLLLLGGSITASPGASGAVLYARPNRDAGTPFSLQAFRVSPGPMATVLDSGGRLYTQTGSCEVQVVALQFGCFASCGALERYYSCSSEQDHSGWATPSCASLYPSTIN